MTAAYTVTIIQRSRWARLWAKLRRQSSWPIEAVWPPCPVCDGAVTAWTPRIRQGAEYHNSGPPHETHKASDEIIGFLLHPCGDEVEHVAMVNAQ